MQLVRLLRQVRHSSEHFAQVGVAWAVMYSPGPQSAMQVLLASAYPTTQLIQAV